MSIEQPPFENSTRGGGKKTLERTKKTEKPESIETILGKAIRLNPKPELKYFPNSVDGLIKGKGLCVNDRKRLVLPGLNNACDGINIPQERWSEAIKVLRCFLDPGLITHGDEKTIVELFRFCTLAATEPDIINKTILTVGFGASETEPSARFPAYIMPALHIMENMQVAGLPIPRLRLLWGSELGIYINGFAREKVENIKNYSQKILVNFIKNFYPELQDFIFFDNDYEPLYLEKVKDRLHKMLLENEKKDKDEQDIITVVRSLASCGNRQGCNAPMNGAMQYLFAHTFIFGDTTPTDFATTQWEKEEGNDIKTIISFGGPPERLFNWGRRFFMKTRLQEINTNLRNSLMFIVRIGEKPVYFPMEDEPVFGKLTPEFTKRTFKKEIAEDYRILPKDYEEWALEFQAHSLSE